MRHLAGSERYWIGEVVGGQPARRHRDAEFGRDRLAKRDLVAEMERVGEQTRAVLGAFADDQWAAEVEVTRMSGTATRTKGYAIIHAAAHLSYHLGQLKLFAKALRGS